MKLLSKKKSIGYFKEKSIYLFNKEIYYRISKDNYSKKYYCGFSSNTTERKYLNQYLEELQPYNTIIVIDSNIGEAYLTLKLLPQILKKVKADNPVIITTQKYHQEIIELFSYSFPHIYMPFLHYSVMKNHFKIAGKEFYICYSHTYYRKIEKSLLGKKPIHFYDAILKHFALNKDILMENNINLSTENKINLDNKIRDINLDINNFVILSPEANSCKQLDSNFWLKLANKFNEMHIDVFLNTVHNYELPNTKSCYLNFEEFCILLQKARGSVFLRSGLCDIATTFVASPTVILYSELNYMKDVDTVAGFSVLPFSPMPSLISEYDACKIKEDILIEKIMRNIL